MPAGRVFARRLIVVTFPCILFAAFASSTPAPQSEQDALFNQAVDAYKQNQFTAATQKFAQVSGTHAQEAQQYIAKIKAYTDAMEVAKSTLDRTADEMDVRSVEYAIEQLQAAIKVKPDGPWQPQQQLAKARQLKDELGKKHAENSKVADARFCNGVLGAVKEKHYKQAAEFSCLLADDNPGYMCGGDEAVHLCEMNTELAKLDKGSVEETVKGGLNPRTVPVPSSAALDKAKAAFERNDFDRARELFQHVDGEAKPAADEFLDKIARYNDSFTNGEKLSRAAQYDQARSAFLAAAGIKPDGPGDPGTRASRMELLLALDQFYSGDYVSAAQHFQSCGATETGKQSLVHFYLGASKLGRFFVTGGEDRALRQEALNEFKLAKKAGFQPVGLEISPRILSEYKDLTF